MKIIQLKLGIIDTNCYIVIDEVTNAAFVVDPADCNDELINAIKGVDVQCVFLTHCHFDHTKGTERLKEKTGAKVVIGNGEEVFIKDPRANLSSLFFLSEKINFGADILASDSSEITCGGLTVKVISTPGHTPFSVCYICGNSIFTGDTLFRGSCGRTDQYGGNPVQLSRSLKKIAAIDGDYKIYPGHNNATTLNRERFDNPFIS